MPRFSSFARSLPVVAAFVLALPACSAEPRPVGVAPPTRIPNAPETALNQPVERVPTASVPAEIRRLVVADAAAHLKIAPGAVVLASAERVTWSDGSLGCPRDSMGFIQTIQPGFRVVAKTRSQELVYHTNDRVDQAASVVRCTAPAR